MYSVVYELGSTRTDGQVFVEFKLENQPRGLFTHTKRDAILEDHWGVSGFHDWLRLLPFIVNSLDPWIKKRVNYLSCIVE